METIAHSLKPGVLLVDRYRIQDLLGEGGFGITYRARDQRLERTVVIKEYLPSEMGARAGDAITVRPRTHRENDYRHGLEKYLDEAKALAKFTHPNIVQILDHFEANGTAYIVMNYEAGQTLDARLKQPGSRLDPAQTLDLLVPLLQGLDKVHQAGLLHRDIKPGNIYLRDEGGPLLIDFGAARHALLEHSKSLSAIVSQGYAPPEQYSSHGKQGPWTDLYALGAVLYRLLTGQVPPESVVRSHALNEDEPDPLIPAAQAAQGRAEPWLLELTDRLLAIKSKDRPQSCGQILQAIAQARQGKPPAAEPPPPPVLPKGGKTQLLDDRERFPQMRQQARKQRRRAWKATGALAGVFALAAIAYQIGRQDQKQVQGTTEIIYPSGSQRPAETVSAVEAPSSSKAQDDRNPTGGMEFVRIEGGEFLMGSPAGEKDRDDGEKQHRVSVAGFYMGKYEVTNGQYRRFKPRHDSGDYNGKSLNGDDQPVVNVSWEEAMAYAEWLSQQTGKKYRLPTEAEWEYAARAGTTGPFSTGRCINTDQANYDGNYDYNGCGAKTGTYRQKTLPVGSLAANPWGLYDMHGNVWEWTCSAYDSVYAGGEQKCTGKNNASGYRALRGGSWGSKPGDVRSAYRSYNSPGYRFYSIGFRLLQD